MANLDTNKNFNNHKITLDNRHNLCITGVSKVSNINPNIVCCLIQGTMLEIIGKNLEVDKLDTNSGIVEIIGNIDGIKYQMTKENFLKRIFK